MPAAKPCPRGAVECRREAAVKAVEAVAERRSVPAATPCPRGAVECRREAAVKAVEAVAERRSAGAQQILLDPFSEGVHALAFRIGEFRGRGVMFGRRDYK